MAAMRIKQLIVLGVVALGLAGCTSTGSGTGADAPIRKTDVETLREDWLPNLEGVESAVWETGALGNNNDRAVTVPGPTDYFAYGFATLSPEQAETYRSTYEFGECQPFEIPDTLNDVAPENQDWTCDQVFSRDIQEVDGGTAAMNSDGVVYFSLQTY
ncbi:MAG: hypothetical protein IKZ87_08210 [Actinomycetaceae bacterium]|nr:hypothetical protein [Actinomycetaceae bacterium]